MNKKTQQGFTLYELMITVAIVGVILSIGIPNMQAYSQNSRMTATANDLHAAFHLARSEASRAKENITLCASANSIACLGTFDQGYIVFVDLDGDLSVGVNEPILSAQPAIADGVSLALVNNATYFSFAASGLGRGIVNGNAALLSQVVMCDERGNITAAGGNSAARLFVATPLGRATIQRDKTMIQKVIDDNNLACP